MAREADYGKLNFTLISCYIIGLRTIVIFDELIFILIYGELTFILISRYVNGLEMIFIARESSFILISRYVNGLRMVLIFGDSMQMHRTRMLPFV